MQLTLKEWRERKGWTLAQAAEATGINKSTLSRLERGTTQPYLGTVEAIERGFRLRRGSVVFQALLEDAV